jgi:hypothetical protein
MFVKVLKDMGQTVELKYIDKEKMIERFVHCERGKRAVISPLKPKYIKQSINSGVMDGSD